MSCSDDWKSTFQLYHITPVQLLAYTCSSCVFLDMDDTKVLSLVHVCDMFEGRASGQIKGICHADPWLAKNGAAGLD